MPRRDKQNHNQYYDSEEMLMQGFFKSMEEQGIDLNAQGEIESSDDAPFFMSQRPSKQTDESKKIKTIGAKQASAGNKSQKYKDMEESSGFMSMQFLEDLAEMLEEIKSASVATFEKYADKSDISIDIEQIIRLLERVQEHTGVDFEKFQPLKHRSGLKARDKLENTNVVVANTIDNYQSYPLVDIRSAENGSNPALLLTIVGETEEIGFVSTGLISAKTDFTGAEAIDYVHEAGTGGIMAVKTNRNGRWVDVSDDFTIKLRYEEYDLQKKDGFAHSIFLGEKIVDKKDFLLKQAKLEDGIVEFGEFQAFAKDSRILEKIRDAIKVKPE